LAEIITDISIEDTRRIQLAQMLTYFLSDVF